MDIIWHQTEGDTTVTDISYRFGENLRGVQHQGRRPDRIMIDVAELDEYLHDQNMQLDQVRQYVRMLKYALTRLKT